MKWFDSHWEERTQKYCVNTSHDNRHATWYPNSTKPDIRVICLHRDSILFKLGEKHIAISILNNYPKIARNFVYYTTCCFDNCECINILFRVNLLQNYFLFMPKEITKGIQIILFITRNYERSFIFSLAL